MAPGPEEKLLEKENQNNVSRRWLYEDQVQVA